MPAVPYQGILNSCCFCFNLKSGSTLIASLTLTVCAIQLWSYLVMMEQFEMKVMHCHHLQANGKSVEGILVDNCLQHSLWFVRSMLVFRSMVFIIGVIGSLLLVRGINRRIPSLFHIWFVFCFISGVNLMVLSHPNDIFNNLVLGATLAYCYLVVKSYQKKLVQEIEEALPVISSARADNFTSPPGGISSVVCCIPGQPKDTAPPPYSSVSPPPPPYSTVTPLGMSIPTGTNLNGESQILEQSNEEAVGQTGAEEPPPSYEESNKNSDRSDELTVAVPTEGAIATSSDVAAPVIDPK